MDHFIFVMFFWVFSSIFVLLNSNKVENSGVVTNEKSDILLFYRKPIFYKKQLQRRFCTWTLMSIICHHWHLQIMSDVIDDRHKSHQYGCLQKRLCKCSNLVEKWNWLDHYVRNESQYDPLAYFPLYIFGISFMK